MEKKEKEEFEKLELENEIECEYIGKGGFGRVYKVKQKGNNEWMLIIKEIDNIYDNNEVRISKHIEEIGKINENVAIYKIIPKENDKKKNDELVLKKYDKSKTYLTSKYYNGGNLLEFIKNYKEITMEMIQYIMKHIIHGLNFLHLNEIYHKDIKPENILIHYENEEDKKRQDIFKSLIVIIDYGLSKFNIKDDYDNENGGTMNYRHPKINENILFNEKENNTLKEELDIWSLGLVCLELFTRKSVFDYNKAKEHDEKLNLAKSETYEIPLNDNTYIEFVSFIDHMLRYNPEKQLTSGQLLKHDFLKKNVETFTKFTKEKAGNKFKNGSLVLNFRQKDLNFEYEKLYDIKKDDKEEISNLFNKIFVYLNENSLFTDQILIPIIPKIDENENANENEND